VKSSTIYMEPST